MDIFSLWKMARNGIILLCGKTKEYQPIIDEFRKNPKAQIKAAIKLAKAFQNGFKGEDLAKARSMGINMSGLIGGAWLGGVGGVRKVINGTGDPSDKHWSKTGAGSSVSACIQRYNNL